MIKILIVADTYKDYNSWITEFVKRLWRKVDIVKVGTKKHLWVKWETQKVKDILWKMKGYKVLLSVVWKQVDTHEFKSMIQNNIAKNGDIVFVIWWAYWLEEDLLNDQIDFKLSLSKLTFPHLLSLLVLLEQIYRSEQLQKNSGYHH